MHGRPGAARTGRGVVNRGSHSTGWRTRRWVGVACIMAMHGAERAVGCAVGASRISSSNWSIRHAWRHWRRLERTRTARYGSPLAGLRLVNGGLRKSKEALSLGQGDRTRPPPKYVPAGWMRDAGPIGQGHRSMVMRPAGLIGRFARGVTCVAYLKSTCWQHRAAAVLLVTAGSHPLAARTVRHGRLAECRRRRLLMRQPQPAAPPAVLALGGIFAARRCIRLETLHQASQARAARDIDVHQQRVRLACVCKPQPSRYVPELSWARGMPPGWPIMVTQVPSPWKTEIS